MTDRSNRTRVALLLCAVGFTSACLDLDMELTDAEDPRLLDRICDYQPCEVEGSAQRVSGLTEDSTGFRLGPGPGAVHLPLEARNASYYVEVLVAGQGHLDVRIPEANASSERIELSDEYRWVRLDGNSLGVSNGWGEVLEVVVSLQDDGSEAEIADVRAHGMSTVGGCSVATVGKR